ncbi:MAG TPA: aminotransferase class I/II-fold pyridoxal phosphate-dependent enzyme [Planctomycetota bacterium]|nr:aminotransferase class I/II-fold pyridoxal phosphate-dependent enzyme [Planctomycetota bacterium]
MPIPDDDRRLRPSRRLAAIGGYAFDEVNRRVEALKARGISPVDFGVGDPTVPTPALAREALQRAVDARATAGYPAYEGDPAFREAVAAWTKRRFGVTLDPRTEICATIGSKEAVFNVHEGLVDPGDLVLCPSPGYPPYKRGTAFAEGTPWFYPLVRSNGFLPDLDAIPAAVAAKARAIWVCYPNSPTGAVADASFYRRLLAWADRHGVAVLSDEAYSEIWFTDRAPVSILCERKEGVLAFFSMSKRSAMTGWRVGWVAGDARLVSLFRKVKTNVDSGTATFVQDGAAAALADEAHVKAFRQEYRVKRDVLVKGLVAAGLPDCTPDSTLYVWQRVPAGMSGVEFAQRLLDPAVAVVCTPGEWLSDPVADGSNPGAGHVRFALVPSLADTKAAASRIANLRF